MRREDGGQATIEFVVVAVALLAIALGLGALAHLLGDGTVVDAASENGAYAIDGAIGVVRYVSLF